MKQVHEPTRSELRGIREIMKRQIPSNPLVIRSRKDCDGPRCGSAKEVGSTMRKLMMSVALGFVVMLAGASMGHADNLMSDPGFELSTANGSFPDSGHWRPSWAPSTAGALCTTTAARNDPGKGLWAYTGDEAAADWSGPYQEFPARAGDVYSAQGWGRSQSAGLWLSGSKALVRIQFLKRLRRPLT